MPGGEGAIAYWLEREKGRNIRLFGTSAPECACVAIATHSANIKILPKDEA